MRILTFNEHKSNGTSYIYNRNRCKSIEKETVSGVIEMKHSKLSHLLGNTLKRIYEKGAFDEAYVQEIRIRIHCPFLVKYKGEEWMLTRDGKKAETWQTAYQIQQKDIKETMSFVADYSIYAYEDELKQGYLTVEGGHRVGVAGKVITEHKLAQGISFSYMKGMKYITYINIRAAHEIKGCSKPLLPYVVEDGCVYHTLIISPPCSGKTTLLRDLIRQLSAGNENFQGYSIGVVDERSELGGSYMGIPQNDLGPRTDILDACPKAEGMMMLIRSMAPEVIAVDEIGSSSDIRAIESVIHCGCKLIATVHGASLDDVKKKPLFEWLLKERVFQRYIVLHNREKIGQIQGVFNEAGECLVPYTAGLDI